MQLCKKFWRLITGVPWSGKFPFKKKSGEVFMAMVTKAPLYEGGEPIGVITVSSDVAVFNSSMDSENRRNHQPGANGQHGAQKLNLKRIQWPPPQMIAPVPQIASSVSNLASKFLRRRTDNTFSRNTTTEEDEEKLEKLRIHETKSYSRHHHGEYISVREASQKEKSTVEFGQPSNIATRVLDKLQPESGKRSFKSNCTTSSRSNRDNDKQSSGGSVTLTSHKDVASREDKEDPLLRLQCHLDLKKLEPEAKDTVIEDEVQKQQEGLQLHSSRESIGSHECSSSKGDNESNSVVECEIHWEDLELREEIGQGSYAIVYLGIWNGMLLSRFTSEMDTRRRLYKTTEKEVSFACTLQIDIMKRLRHPNAMYWFSWE